ncbi:MAG: hypothetical protein ISS53_05365 [Dehalococcoidia bacterium]|nr:hypothetical protein [Dehalococcoidia bacterium]
MLPYSKASDKAARVLSDQEVSILDIEAIDRAGNKLHVQGMLMGTLPTDMYVGVEDFYRVLVMLLSPSVLTFALLSPFHWVKSCCRTYGRRSTASILVKMLPLWMIAAFLVAMVVLGIYSLAV